MSSLKRSVFSNEIKPDFENREVSLSGWVNTRRDHGGLIFIDLRDRTGLMQLVFNPDYSRDAHAIAHQLRPEDVISVKGVVVKREQDTINSELPTGKWELQVKEAEILNKSKTPPFHLEEADQVDEELRLKYRYIDLRRPQMQKKLALRSSVFFLIRSFLIERGFYEVETPILSKNTPEGAREYLVPSRLNPQYFYALPQSPQLYKQLLMASGIERYFQIARCFRDEDLRADRQPEFTQLDIEMSFVDEDDIQYLIEKLLYTLWKETLGISLTTPFERLTYDQAWHTYGTDAPDMRFDLPIYEVTSLFKDTKLKFIQTVLEKNGKIGALHISAHTFSRSELDKLVALAQQMGAKGLLWIKFKDGTIESPVAKFLPDDFYQRVKESITDVTPNSTLFLIAGPYGEAWKLLGRLRIVLAKELDMIPQDVYKFVWVTDFPLFEWDPEAKRWDSVHHPFTSPKEGWESKEIDTVKARAYDIVLNGTELGGGSIRIHQSALQKKIFETLGLDDAQVKEKFGFLLEAQDLGFPPHGGIALGLDRMLMIMSKSLSIRDVIAFPKTARGHDPLMASPTKIDTQLLSDYKLKVSGTKK